MGGYKLILSFIVVVYCEVYGHPFHTRSRSLHKPLFRDSCSYTCDDLASLLALSRTLDQKEEPEKEIVTAPAMFNADELIMKLVNALVYATTQRVPNHYHCHCAYSDKPSVSQDSQSNGRVIRPNNSPNGHHDDGLLNLDLLDPNKRNNVLELDLSNQHLVGVGLGGRNQDQSSYTSSSTYSRANNNDPDISSSHTSNSKSSNGLIDVALLDSKNPNNLAAVNLGKQNVVGVSLLGEANENRRQDKTDEGLVNLYVLNPKNKDNNVAELAVAGENVVGVKIGG